MPITVKPGDPMVVIDLGDAGTVEISAKYIAKATVPDPQPNPQPVGKTHAVYYMCWPTSGSPAFASIPAQFNEIRLAFAQSGPQGLRLVGSGSQSSDVFKTAIWNRRKAGTRVLISIGGQSGAVDTSNVAKFVADIEAIISTQTGPVDGIDWDVEAAALNKANVLAINQALIKAHPDWRISFAPNGSNVDAYLPVAVETYRSITRNVVYGQQFYDAVVTWGAAAGRINAAINAGLPPGVLLLGMMNPMSNEPAATQAKRWTVEVCAGFIRSALQSWKGFGGAYVWEAGRQRNADYAIQVGSALASS